ncbi:hxlR-like helix-turn-helix family protein [Mycobacterium ulcerans str. Harvey]|uniref:HxlR-like helix-turn-helix family protein n=1 Tax=Mycobacterium ulcerans str. Harvey TaxID=1299332 RepID=A0ABN0R478_MYCUL|nr:hxlR-like helix-turn-helix family protein [Mycobacterium ulcerans str. Harvey]
MSARNYNQNCPIARGLDILGERWTLLILRELVGGPRRYGDLRAELAGIATNLLAQRLAELQERGLVDRTELPRRSGGLSTPSATAAGGGCCRSCRPSRGSAWTSLIRSTTRAWFRR